MARKHDINVNITANDQASSVFQRVRVSASSMSSNIMSSLNKSAVAFDKFESGLRRYNNSMYGFNRAVSNFARVAGDSIYNFTKDAINNFSALEQQHAKTMGAMATEYDKTTEAQRRFLEDSKKLQQQALLLGTNGPTGKGSLYTPDQVAYAQTALVKSGLTANDLLHSGAIESILKFAGGNDLDIDTATQFAVNLGTVFNKPVEEWTTMLDMITKAADISVIDVEDIMDSLTYTGGIASGLGRDLEEVLGVISVMGQAGLRGRVAGTGLQAFFTRILSSGELTDTQVGNAPTEYVGQMYNAFVTEAVNADGTFKDMDEVAELLDTAMGELSDQEQAWFAKKLFGLYQMKAAYALTGSVDGDENLITNFIDQITNQSAGSNDAKLNEMLESQYGKIERLKNRWEGTKTDFGARLSPVTEGIVDELFNFLGDPQNYEINWDSLHTAISESGGLIGEKYGDELGKAIEDIGNFGINGAQIAESLLPYAGGLIGGIGKLLNGDISGAIDEFSQGIDDTNRSIDGLPEELQGTAKSARNAIVALTALAGVNLVTQIAQPIVTAINTMLGKPIQMITGKITSTNTNVTSTTVTIGSAATVNISKVPLMNVTATVVNVYGGGGNPTNTPSSPSSPSGTPLLPGGGTPLLPTGNIPTLPGGGSPLLLPGAGAGAYAASRAASFGAKQMVLDANGKVLARYWNVGGKMMSGSQIAASAGKLLGVAGVLAMASSIPSSGVDPDSQYASLLNEGVEKGYDNDKLRQYLYNNWHSNITDKSAWGDEYRENERQGIVKKYDAQTEMYAKWMTTEGATEALTAIKEELETQGELSEQFLRELVTNEGSTGGTYAGSQSDLEFLLSILFDKEYKKPWLFGGSFADKYTSKFVQGALDEGQTYNLESLTDALNTTAVNTSDAIMGLNNAIDRINSPSINVNVTTNVDKSGNATSKVDINSTSRDIARRSSQYGQVAMDK